MLGQRLVRLLGLLVLVVVVEEEPPMLVLLPTVPTLVRGAKLKGVSAIGVNQDRGKARASFDNDGGGTTPTPTTPAIKPGGTLKVATADGTASGEWLRISDVEAHTSILLTMSIPWPVTRSGKTDCKHVGFGRCFLSSRLSSFITSDLLFHSTTLHSSTACAFATVSLPPPPPPAFRSTQLIIAS